MKTGRLCDMVESSGKRYHSSNSRMNFNGYVLIQHRWEVAKMLWMKTASEHAPCAKEDHETVFKSSTES